MISRILYWSMVSFLSYHSQAGCGDEMRGTHRGDISCLIAVWREKDGHGERSKALRSLAVHGTSGVASLAMYHDLVRGSEPSRHNTLFRMEGNTTVTNTTKPEEEAVRIGTIPSSVAVAWHDDEHSSCNEPDVFAMTG